MGEALTAALGTVMSWLGEHWISLTALCVSGYTLWSDRLKSFCLAIRSSGRITLTRQPWSPGLAQDALFLDLVFANTGSRSGFLDSVGVVVRGGGTSTLLGAHSEMTDRTLSLGSNLPPPSLTPFVGRVLHKGESQTAKILFVPNDPSSTFQFALGRYALDVYARSQGGSAWKKMTSIEVEVTQPDLLAIASSSATPNPAGGHFVKWIFQDKYAELTEEGMKRLGKQTNSK